MKNKAGGIQIKNQKKDIPNNIGFTTKRNSMGMPS